MSENYLDLAVEEVYKILNNDRTPWPKSMRDHRDKIKFLDSLIKHFETTEDYEKCSYLTGMKNELENHIQAD